MGTYICEANNGIGEVARQNFKVQVHCKSLSVLRTYLPTKGGEGLIKIFVVVVAPLLYLSHFKDTQMYHQDVLAKKCSLTLTLEKSKLEAQMALTPFKVINHVIYP